MSHHSSFINLFEDQKATWKKSAWRDALEQRLDAHKLKNGWHICQAVLLATGNISDKAGVESNGGVYEDLIIQMVVFLDIVSLLSDLSTEQIRLFAQDSNFMTADIEILTSLGLEILLIPMVEEILAVGSEIFVMCPFYGKEYRVFCKSYELHPQPALGLTFGVALGRAKAMLLAAQQYDILSFHVYVCDANGCHRTIGTPHGKEITEETLQKREEDLRKVQAAGERYEDFAICVKECEHYEAASGLELMWVHVKVAKSDGESGGNRNEEHLRVAKELGYTKFVL